MSSANEQATKTVKCYLFNRKSVTNNIRPSAAWKRFVTVLPSGIMAMGLKNSAANSVTHLCSCITFLPV